MTDTPDTSTNSVRPWRDDPTRPVYEIDRAWDQLGELREEMAEAILDLAKWDCTCETPYSREHHSKLDCVGFQEIAAKLRALGNPEAAS